MKFEKENLAILNIFSNKIFHVTSLSAFEGIKRDLMLKSNRDNFFPSNFPQSEKCFARQKGWVPFFDFRDKTEQQITDSAGDCLFRLLSKHKSPIALILDPIFCKDLIYQRKYTKNVSNENSMSSEEIIFQRGTYVPYTECWYPGDMPYQMISEVIKF